MGASTFEVAMYAVVQTGGKQYKVAEGEKLLVEKLEGAVGTAVVLDQVLAVGGEGDFKVGSPLVSNAKVEAQIAEQVLGDKIIVLKKKRRKGYRKKQGHRQHYTVLKIGKIVG